MAILVISCKKNDYREAVASSYVGIYYHFSGWDSSSTSGITTVNVSIDPNSDDGLIFTNEGSSFNAKLFEDYHFANAANCSPHGVFRNDSLIYSWGCSNAGAFSGTQYYLKKQ
jgi:hypothetical protein